MKRLHRSTTGRHRVVANGLRVRTAPFGERASKARRRRTGAAAAPVRGIPVDQQALRSYRTGGDMAARGMELDGPAGNDADAEAAMDKLDNRFDQARRQHPLERDAVAPEQLLPFVSAFREGAVGHVDLALEVGRREEP